MSNEVRGTIEIMFLGLMKHDHFLFNLQPFFKSLGFCSNYKKFIEHSQNLIIRGGFFVQITVSVSRIC